jgi:hypothetical protein
MKSTDPIRPAPLSAARSHRTPTSPARPPSRGTSSNNATRDSPARSAPTSQLEAAVASGDKNKSSAPTSRRPATRVGSHASSTRTSRSAGVATALALGASSLVFGALHAVTPLYFAWATAAGALFGMSLAPQVWALALTTPAACRAGWEYLATGGELSACAATHALYDLIAFIAIARLWGPPPGASDEPRNEA